jgi:hypothetical protein
MLSGMDFGGGEDGGVIGFESDCDSFSKHEAILTFRRSFRVSLAVEVAGTGSSSTEMDIFPGQWTGVLTTSIL